MEYNAKRIGLMNWIVLLGAAIGLLLVARFVSSRASVLVMLLTTFGLLVALLSYFHMSLVEREQFEKMEMEELSKARGSQSLFASAGADTFPARRSREQFERFVIPLFAGLLFLAQASAAWWLWGKIAQMPPLIPMNSALAMALLGLFGMILFLLGKYSAGL